MKKPGLLLCIFFVSLIQLSAQLSVEVVLDQEQFLPGETLLATVRITNRSGQTLHLGDDQTWLTFSVESPGGIVVNKLGDAPVTQKFNLESSQRANVKNIDLAPYFTLTRSGHYSVIATVQIKEWNGQAIHSAAKSFDIIEGVKLWEREFGLPRAPGVTNQPPEVRKYSLQQANYLRSQLRLYFRLTDSAGKVSKVVPIGPMLSFGQPEPEVDRYSNLHVLYQNGPHTFSHTVFNPDGELIIRRFYDFTSTRPSLKKDKDGKLGVVGGERHLSADDLPKETKNDAVVPPRA